MGRTVPRKSHQDRLACGLHRFAPRLASVGGRGPQCLIEYPFFGAAPGASIIPYRITDSVIIDHVPDLLAEAITDAVNKGAEVISISLGALRPDKRVAKAVQHAYQQGVIVCAAAGQVFREVIYPGRFNCVITVGSATTMDGRSFHPWRVVARGPDVDICGPADQIRRPTTVMSGGGTKFLISGPGDGTSFAPV
ncbi:MAG: S8 family serine peptidase [Burkholderiales bacterium]|nr:S8 family serine peptidase [Burkholderiales bacterium]